VRGRGNGEENRALAPDPVLAGIYISRRHQRKGHMAQMEQTKIYFTVQSLAEETGFVDTASAMTACNHKQYHHVARDGQALCYRLLVTAIKGTWTLSGAPHGFPTANAVKKTSAGWKAQLRHSGIKMRDLPTYGRRPRFALSRFGVVSNQVAIADEEIFEISAGHLQPLQGPGGSKWFTDYESSDGMDVSYRGLAAQALGSLAANQVTQVTVTDQSTTPETSAQKPLVLLGTTAPEFSVVSEWMKSRRGVETFSEDTPGMEADSELANLFSVSEEYSDEVIGGVEEYMDWQPYQGSVALNSPWVRDTEYCTISSATAVDVQYPLNSAVIDVPLGLFSLTASDDSHLMVDVLAIYEM